MANSQYFPKKSPVGTGEVFLGTQTILSASRQVRKSPYSIAKHIHRTIEIYQIDSSCCEMDINNKTFLFQEKDFILIYPNTVHSFHLKRTDVCAFRHIHFGPSFYSRWYLDQGHPYALDLISALTIPCDYYLHMAADKKISFLVDAIIEETNEESLLSSAMSNLHMAELLLYLIQLIRPNHAQLTDEATHAPEQIRYVTYALSYIHEHYASKILIPEIAAHLNISARYLSKLFFHHMNLTILNYINIYRINQAIDLMSDATLTLTSISTQVGLKDSQHFSKLFRSIIGLPPSQYRKLLLHDMSEESPEEDGLHISNAGAKS